MVKYLQLKKLASTLLAVSIPNIGLTPSTHYYQQ